MTYTFASWTDNIQHSLMRRLNRHFQGLEDFISLAGGLPDPELMPTEALAAAANQALLEQYPTALQYGGDRPGLKQHIANLMKERGVECQPNNIEVTSGGQQCMDLLSKIFLDQGDTIAMADLSYAGVRQASRLFKPNIISIPIDPQTGLDINFLEQKLKDGARPKFLYTVVSAHNPVGVTMSLANRQRLMKLARQYEIVVFEDDAYGFLEYDGEQLPALTSIDPEWAVYIGSFAKILAPGIRMGWVIAPDEILEKVGVAKQMATLSTSPMSQHIVQNYLDNNDFPAQIDSLRTVYGRRRDVMMDAIEEHFPAGVETYRPTGGMFVWVKLPDSVDAMDVVKQAAAEESVGCNPGAAFGTTPADEEKYKSYLRLTFVRYDENVVADGIARLGRTLKKLC
ncbi:MAG: PLP-dependent aminotransferase family protein [Anaerolineae bacterium]